MQYRRLTHEERYQLDVLLRSGLSTRAIARMMDRSPSTVSRELGRASNRRDYSPEKAQRAAKQRSLGRYDSRRKIQGEVERYVRTRIQLDWSPEQISGRMRRTGHLSWVSHQTIYRFLERNRQTQGELWKHLRILRRQRKDRKKPNWKPASRLYPQRTYLKDRPKIVEERTRLGDYERDSVLGKFNGPFLLTLVDRTSRRVKLAWIETKSASLIHKATVRKLRHEPLKTITNDNGTEFARHKQTAQALRIQIYFSHAYRSWERGTNENTNGLIRQYFPRRSAIENSNKIHKVEKMLNARPRKCLGFQTPDEVHEKLKSSVLR